MKENSKLFETLIERATDYGKTSYELAKLKTIDKASDIASSILPRWLVLVLCVTFMLFLNVGLALWIGELMGKTYFGFFIVAAFYAFMALIVNVFLHNWLKSIARNCIIKLILK